MNTGWTKVTYNNTNIEDKNNKLLFISSEIQRGIEELVNQEKTKLENLIALTAMLNKKE